MSKIYAYSSSFDQSNSKEWQSRKDKPGIGILKVGRTDKQTVEARIRQQFKGAAFPSGPEFYYTIEKVWDAFDNTDTLITDKILYDAINKRYPGSNIKGGGGVEWFEITVEELDTLIKNLQLGLTIANERTYNYILRPEQESFIRKASTWYEKNSDFSSLAPEERSFLLNGKMRFGKTFASLKLAQSLNFKCVLILTHKPSVKASWYKDWSSHIDFENTIWLDSESSETEIKEAIQADKLIIGFYSYQDLTGDLSNIKKKHKWLYETNWDIIVNDEYHYGAWNDRSKGLFSDYSNQDLDAEELEYDVESNSNNYTPGDLGGIRAKYYLYLSGTPFRSLETGELSAEQIFSWTYADEQLAKKTTEQKIQNGTYTKSENPYSELPKMCILTYNLPPDVKLNSVDENGWFNLNKFFAARKSEKGYKFVNERHVSYFLEYLWNKRSLKAIGRDSELDGLELPFKNSDMQNYLSHTFWLLPSVASVFAMQELLSRDTFFQKYTTVAIAGSAVGTQQAIEMVEESIKLNKKTITLSCGKLTTGSTVPEWTGVFMLSGVNAPETYMQTAFRAGTPHFSRDNVSGEKKILKSIFYVFDFAPSRTLRKVYDLAKLQIPEDYSNNIKNTNSWNAEDIVANLIDLLPIYSFDGASMQQLDAESIMQVIEYGTTNELLAKRWRSDSLVCLSNKEMKNLLQDEVLMKALSKIIQYRKTKETPTKEIFERVISRESIVSKAKEQGKKPPKLSEDEKKTKAQIDEIKDKLKTFVQRIPAFMYFTDEREKTLIDVVHGSKSNLFEKTTGLTIQEFTRLYQAGIFNAQLISDLIWRFRNFENGSFGHMGEYDAKRTETYGGMDSEIHAEDSTKL